MAGINNIIDHIKTESDKDVNKIISEAQQYAEDLMNESKKNADNEINSINKKCEQELKSIDERSVSSSELKTKQLKLECKHEIIVETIEKAKQKMINFPDDEYVKYIKKVFIKNIPERDCAIVFNAKDLKRIPKETIAELIALAKEKGVNLKLSEKVANIQSGFILDFGDVEGNCSFESLIDQNIDCLVDKINNILFS